MKKQIPNALTASNLVFGMLSHMTTPPYDDLIPYDTPLTDAKKAAMRAAARIEAKTKAANKKKK